MTERMHDCQNMILDLARTIHRQRSEAIREFFGEPAYSTFSDNWEAEAAQDHETPLVNVSHEEASVHPGWLDLRRRMEGVQRLALPEYDRPAPRPPPGGLGGVRDQWRDRPWDSTRPIYRFPGESNQEAEDRLAQGSDGDSSTPNDRPGIYIHLHHLKQLHHALRSEREELTNLPHRDPASEQRRLLVGRNLTFVSVAGYESDRIVTIYERIGSLMNAVTEGTPLQEILDHHREIENLTSDIQRIYTARLDRGYTEIVFHRHNNAYEEEIHIPLLNARYCGPDPPPNPYMIQPVGSLGEIRQSGLDPNAPAPHPCAPPAYADPASAHQVPAPRRPRIPEAGEAQRSQLSGNVDSNTSLSVPERAFEPREVDPATVALPDSNSSSSGSKGKGKARKTSSSASGSSGKKRSSDEAENGGEGSHGGPSRRRRRSGYLASSASMRARMHDG